MHTRRVCANQRETVMSGEKAMAAVETPQGEIERLRKVLDEVQTNQAEHAAHLDQLAHRADLERGNVSAGNSVSCQKVGGSIQAGRSVKVG